MKLVQKLLLPVLVLLFMLILPPAAYANQVNVSINGQQINFADQTPKIVDAHTLVPVRDVFEALGFEVSWNGTTHTATLTNDDYMVIITIGRRTFTTNGTSHTLDVPAQIIGGRTMLPIRAILESTGYYVGWNGRTQTVIVRSEPIGSNSIYNLELEFVVEYHSRRGFIQSNRNLIVRSTEELLQIAENHIFTNIVYPDPNIKGYFLEITAEFDDDFFAESMLVLVNVHTSTGMASVRVDKVTLDKDNLLNVHAKINIPDGAVTMDIGEHFLILNLPLIENADINSVITDIIRAELDN